MVLAPGGESSTSHAVHERRHVSWRAIGIAVLAALSLWAHLRAPSGGPPPRPPPRPTMMDDPAWSRRYETKFNDNKSDVDESPLRSDPDGDKKARWEVTGESSPVPQMPRSDMLPSAGAPRPFPEGPRMRNSEGVRRPRGPGRLPPRAGPARMPTADPRFEPMVEPSVDPPAPGYEPRTTIKFDVAAMVQRTLREFPDPRAAPPQTTPDPTAADDSVDAGPPPAGRRGPAKRSRAALPGARQAEGNMAAWVKNINGYFAEHLRHEVPAPVYRHTPGKLAKVALVTAWSMAGGQRRSSEVAPAAIINKVMYCRRHGYDLYVDDTQELLARGGFPKRHPQWAKPLAVAARLAHYEWVVWHDIDIFIMDLDLSVERYLTRFGTNETRHLIMRELHNDRNSMNTAHYMVKRDSFNFDLMHRQFHCPGKIDAGMHDQEALNTIAGRYANRECAKVDPLLAEPCWNDEERAFWSKLTVVAPPRQFGGFVFIEYDYSWWHRFRFAFDPQAHLTFCDEQRSCNEAIAHLFMTSLAFGGFATGHVPEDVLHNPKRPPLVRGAGVFSDPRPRPAATIGVVTLGSYLQPEGPAWLHEPIAARWKAYCERTGCSYDNRGKPDVIWVWHSEPQIIPETGRLKLAETWLPYFEWVLYVDPDVVLADDARSLQDLVAAVPAHIDVVVSRHADTIDPAAFLVRRSKWSMTLMEEILYRNVPTFTEAAKIVFDFTDPSKRFVEKTGYEPFIEKFHLNPFLTDFSPLIESPTLVGTAPDLCDEGRVCDFKKGSHWFLRIAASACAFVPSACQKTASEFAVPSLALKAPPDEPTAAAVTTTATPG